MSNSKRIHSEIAIEILNDMIERLSAFSEKILALECLGMIHKMSSGEISSLLDQLRDQVIDERNMQTRSDSE